MKQPMSYVGRYPSNWAGYVYKEKLGYTSGVHTGYEVSTDGSVRRVPNPDAPKRSRHKYNYNYPKGSLNQKGYRVHKLYLPDGTKVCRPAHRMVAETFIENPDNKEHVNHKDGNKLNNSVDNLEWVTNAENMAHAVGNKLIDNRGEKSGKAKLKESTVRWVMENTHLTLSKQQEATGISKSYLKALRVGKRWNWLYSELKRERRIA